MKTAMLEWQQLRIMYKDENFWQADYLKFISYNNSFIKMRPFSETNFVNYM